MLLKQNAKIKKKQKRSQYLLFYFNDVIATVGMNNVFRFFRISWTEGASTTDDASSSRGAVLFICQHNFMLLKQNAKIKRKNKKLIVIHIILVINNIFVIIGMNNSFRFFCMSLMLYYYCFVLHRLQKRRGWLFSTDITYQVVYQYSNEFHSWSLPSNKSVMRIF